MDISREEVADTFRDAQAVAQPGGEQLGGGPEASDQDAAGGSSGSGGYGKAQNQSFHQGQNGGPDDGPDKPATRELSRGERYDMEQGGGRSDDAVDFEEELKEDQRDQGAVTEGQQP